MDEEGRQCYRCKHFERLYVKGEKRFEMTKYGHCATKSENVGIHCNCDGFMQRPRTARSERVLLPHYLHELLAQIRALREIIEAEKSECEEV